MKKIELTQNAYLTGGEYRIPDENGKPTIYVLSDAWYQAQAVDEDGNEYTVLWTLADGFDPLYDDDEGDACDWDNPFVIICGGKDVTGKVELN